LLVTLTDTLMRGSEAATIPWGQVRFNDGELDFIRWKTSEAATVPMSMGLERELRSYRVWLEQKIDRPVVAEDYLFPSLRVKNGSIVTVKNDDTVEMFPSKHIANVTPIIQRALVAIGFEGTHGQGKWSPLLREGGHTLRRSAARELLEAFFRDEGLNVDEALLIVMNMLGHKSLDMTMTYIGYDRDQQKAMRLLKGKDWWASARPAEVIRLAPRPAQVS
jgi:integrase